jgi:hypothetical protein
LIKTDGIAYKNEDEEEENKVFERKENLYPSYIQNNQKETMNNTDMERRGLRRIIHN